MSHFYTKDGTLLAQVENKSRPGEMRDFTLADARKYPERLYPSVTTYLTVTAKEMVTLWRIEQGIKAVMAEPWDGIELEDDYRRRMVRKADEYSKRAAEYGTEIHNMVCNLLGGKRPERQVFIQSKRIAEEVVFWLYGNGYKVLETEHTFVNDKLGFAGTVDLRVKHPDGRILIGDIKTNDFEKEKDCPFYDEHKYQVAGYDIGEPGADGRVIFYVSRKTIGLVVAKECTEPSRDDRVFMAIREHWHAAHNY